MNRYKFDKMSGLLEVKISKKFNVLTLDITFGTSLYMFPANQIWDQYIHRFCYQMNVKARNPFEGYFGPIIKIVYRYGHPLSSSNIDFNIRHQVEY